MGAGIGWLASAVFSASVAAAPSAEPPADRALVARWSFDDAPGAVVRDQAGGDNDGRLQGSPTAVRVPAGRAGASLGFFANGQEVTGPDAGFPTGARPGSVSLWFLRPRGRADKVLFVYGSRQRGRARGIWLVGEARLCFYFYADPKDLHVRIKGGISAEQWHHVAATYDGKTARLYFDGALAGQVDHKLDTARSGAFHIGANLEADHRDYVGLIDDVAVHARALSAGEVRGAFRRRAALLGARAGADLRAYRAKQAEVVRAAERTRRARTEKLIAKIGVEEIVFAVRQPGKDGHWYANFGYWASDPRRKLYGPGGRLCRLNLRTGKVTTLLEDLRGGVRDPQVHYDGRKILFAYRKGDGEHYHLHEIGTDGTGLRRITDGPFDDFEPTYLPDGDIAFCSSRCMRWVPCWSTEVAVLYRCGADGGGLRPLSSNIEQENTPCVLPDGRLLYTRWEYVDRSQVDFHHLWTMNPDGTGQMVYYGNMHPGMVMIDAQPIPGTRKIVASFSPGHGQPEHAGAVTVVDPGQGPDERARARRITRGDQFRDPFPLSEDLFLVARGASVLLMDGRGGTVEAYRLPAADVRRGLQCHEPRPLRPRPRERRIPSLVDPARSTGRLLAANVAHGRNMAGVRPGQIRKLLVLESLPKPINFNGAYPYEMSYMEPVSLGGTFALARVLGTVPVEADGSACFEVPALRSVFFVALDANGMSVKRMQSFVTVQPGETTGCVGCHERRTQVSPRRQNLAALARPASRIEPFASVPDVPDFPRDVQPILDKHCVRCHRPERREGRTDLTADRTGVYCQSYWAIIKGRLIADGRNQSRGNRKPRTIGASASRLMKLVDGSHYKAKLSDRERLILRLWIEVGAPYAGTYAAYFSGMVSVKFPAKEMTARCGRCHGAGRGGHRRQAWEGQDIRPWAHLPVEFAKAGPAPSLCNLTRPEKSLLLLAPLAKAAGGYGTCGAKAAGGDVLPDTADATYRKMLAAVREAKERLERIKRFDMPQFRPNVHYLREMKRYGILPAGHGRDDPIDVYATDRAYWRSFWYRPTGRR